MRKKFIPHLANVVEVKNMYALGNNHKLRYELRDFPEWINCANHSQSIDYLKER